MVTELVVKTVDIDIVARHSAGEKVDIAMMAQWWRKCRYCYHCTTLDIDIIARRHYFRDVGDKELRQLVSNARNTEM